MGSVTYSFMKDGVVLPGNSSSNTLVVNDMSVKSNGVYECTAEGGQGGYPSNGKKTSYNPYIVSVLIKGELQ